MSGRSETTAPRERSSAIRTSNLSERDIELIEVYSISRKRLQEDLMFVSQRCIICDKVLGSWIEPHPLSLLRNWFGHHDYLGLYVHSRCTFKT